MYLSHFTLLIVNYFVPINLNWWVDQNLWYRNLTLLQLSNYFRPKVGVGAFIAIYHLSTPSASFSAPLHPKYTYLEMSFRFVSLSASWLFNSVRDNERNELRKIITTENTVSPAFAMPSSPPALLNKIQSRRRSRQQRTEICLHLFSAANVPVPRKRGTC